MSTATKPVLLLGAGKIGFAIALMLERSGDYSVLVADQDPARLAAVAELGCETRLIPDDDARAPSKAAMRCSTPCPFIARSRSRACAPRPACTIST